MSTHLPNSIHTLGVDIVCQSQADNRPPCINGDNAIQWECSNFDPSQYPNPLTNYDKTLHNWLRPQDEHITQNVCQSTVRERLGKYVKYKAFFYSDLFFSRTRLLKWPVGAFSRTMTQIMRNHARKCLLSIVGQRDGRQHLGGQISQNRQKGAFLGVFGICEQNGAEWRHRRITSLPSA